MSLTFEERHQLRQLVSDALKARLPKNKNACAGCGINRAEYTWGCDTCTDRRNRRDRRNRNKQPCKNECGNYVTIETNHRYGKPHSGYCQDCWRVSSAWSTT